MATKAPAVSNQPAVIRFKSELQEHPELAKAGSHGLVRIPPAASALLSNMATVEGVINGHPFRAPLERNHSGDVLLRANSAMLKGAAARVGNTVQLAVLGPEPEPSIPADLHAAFAASPEAQRVWKKLTKLGRLDWIRWIESAKGTETRARRIARTVGQLAEGKRRACCVNVYEYMLRRVRESK